MGVSKTTVFNTKQNKMAAYAKALAHPARIAIIQHLLEKKSCICGDLVEVLPLSQSTVSQHLKELKRIGIIKGEINPPAVCYCIDEACWQDMEASLGSFIHSSRILNKCC